MNIHRPIVFFAIPCGQFYSIQSEIVRSIAKCAAVEAIIAEEDLQTKELWDKIRDQIDSADFFVADISSRSSNVILELGYALREKTLRRIAIFESRSTVAMADLQGFCRQPYSSFLDFRLRLIDWFCHSIPGLNHAAFQGTEIGPAQFEDDFLDQDRFMARWSVPPGGSYLLSFEGLRFSDANFPILTTTLGILRDCEVEFKAKIVSGALGWVVKGTKAVQSIDPAFLVMFNTNGSDLITPHIWNSSTKIPSTLYHIFDSIPVGITKDRDSWFTLVTRIVGDSVEIKQNGSPLLSIDFNSDSYASSYDFPGKQGQIGFRCYPGEIATVRYIRVKEL